MDFDPVSKAMRLRSRHPGVALERIHASIGFSLLVPVDVPETARPTAEEIELIRTRIDPHRVLLRHDPEP